MRNVPTVTLFVALVVMAAFVLTTPVHPDEPHAKAEVDLISSIRSDLRTKDGDLQASTSWSQASSSVHNFNSPPHTQFKPTQFPSTLHPIFAPLPAVRSDVVDSLLSSRFSVKSNIPLDLLLTPAERSSITQMAGQHLKRPGATWMFSVVQEPRLDLTYSRQLYVSSPILGLDWRKATGLPESEDTSTWLPVAFYKADIDHSQHDHFKVAGIEVVRDPREVKKIITGWNSPDTLQGIVKMLRRGVSDGVHKL